MTNSNPSPHTPATSQRPTHLRSHTFHGLAPGPRLLVLGAVHGNETCGALAIGQLLQDIDSGAVPIERGSVTLVPVTNPLAWQLGQRMGERNLNRNLASSAVPQDFEDQIANVLCPLLDAHDVLLDLHSFHTGGSPFVMVGPQDNRGALEPFSHAASEFQLALHTGPHRIVEGWLDTYSRGVQRRAARPTDAGTARSLALVTNTNYGVGTTEYMRSRGGYGVTLECGQHEDPQGQQVARHAILQTLALLGISPLPLKPEPVVREILRLVDVVDREHADDAFAQEWRSFDAVRAGQVVGHRHSGELVAAPQDGFIVFPNPRAMAGQEWFYFAKRRA